MENSVTPPQTSPGSDLPPTRGQEHSGRPFVFPGSQTTHLVGQPRSLPRCPASQGIGRRHRLTDAHRQRGAALLLAMLVLAMATIAASQFAFRGHIEGRKLENLAQLDQARWLLRAGEQWAAAVLWDDARQGNVDHLGEVWARPMPPVETEGLRLRGRIEDMDGRFNLNNLVGAGSNARAQQAVFQRLLGHLGLPLEISTKVQNWLDVETSTFDRSGQKAALQPAAKEASALGRPLINLGELAALPGMNADILARLRPFVSALPQRTRINLNTAPAEVIAALVPDLGIDEAYALVARRERAHFNSFADVAQALPPGVHLDPDLATLASRYFRVTAYAEQDRIRIGSEALFLRDSGNFPVLIWRTAL